jgi:hypothetical protein
MGSIWVRRLWIAALIPGFLSWIAWGATLESPFPSRVKGLSIPNAHELIRGPGRVIRGNAPNHRIQELIDLGITDVLMFKTPNDVLGTDSNDLEMERQALASASQQAGRKVKVHWIPFPWRGFTSMEEGCRQVIQGLKVIEEVARDSRRSLFFHCTVGEDRTGLLAGMARMLHDDWNTKKAFYREMCGHGYEAGNPYKPLHVAEVIRKELTPLFLRMAAMAEEGLISSGELNESVCRGIAERPLPKGKWRCWPQPAPGRP